LIVDDSPVNRQIFAAFLQGTGAQVVFAQDGREALGLFPNMHPDLVIMDLCMPIMSGAEATEAIRDLEASLGWERCPILAVSASALREDVAAAEAAGCDEHFAKPIRRGALVGAIEKHLHRAATRPVSAGGMCLSPLSRQATLGPAAGDGRMGS
jgi:CheY-like chemotaxis protein